MQRAAGIVVKSGAGVMFSVGALLLSTHEDHTKNIKTLSPLEQEKAKKAAERDLRYYMDNQSSFGLGR